MSIQTLREFLDKNAPMATAVAAIEALLEAHASGTPLEPEVAARARALLAVLGAGDVLEGITPQEARRVGRELFINRRLEAQLRRGASGWTHTDPEILEAAGVVSAGFVEPLSRAVVPTLPGLAERLEAPGSAFLDIGVGVAGLAIAVARKWPAVRVVGIDPWQPALALARNNVAAAGLGDRIELREQRGDELTDEATFDFAWVATNFISERAMPALLVRALRALRPGGWMLVSAMNPDLEPAAAAMWRLRSLLMGNASMLAPDLAARLREAGAADVRVLPTPAGSFLTLVAAQRSG